MYNKSNTRLLLLCIVAIIVLSGLLHAVGRVSNASNGLLAHVQRVPRLVDLSSINPRIKISLVYSTPENFTKTVIYPQSAKAYLDKAVAMALSKVQEDLEKKGLGLIVWDAYRPLAAQRLMWQVVPDERYVTNPRKGGRHTRGTAVDVTLVDLKSGKKLEMPTEFDDFTEKAWRSNKQCSLCARQNRQLLEDAMKRHGFSGAVTEWWHFDYKDWQSYEVRDDSFDELAKKVSQKRVKKESNT